MLKYLAILLVIIGAAFIIARHDEYASLKSVEIPAQSDSSTVPTTNKKPPNNNSSHTYWDTPSGHIFHNAFKWPEGITVWAIILTLLAIAEQTAATRQAAEATQASAEATSRQVALYENAERARMTMDISEMGRSFKINAQNTGRAIAKILYARGISVILPYGQPLPAEPSYLKEEKREGEFIEWIAFGKQIDLFNGDWEYGLLADFSDISLCEDIRDKKRILWVYGRICYQDGISPNIRETRFCYEASVTPPLETYLAMGGSPIYRIET